MGEQEWYAGNTHVHYGAQETNAGTRLRLDPRSPADKGPLEMVR
jgi:hypothetical protein